MRWVEFSCSAVSLRLDCRKLGKETANLKGRDTFAFVPPSETQALSIEMLGGSVNLAPDRSVRSVEKFFLNVGRQ